mmetsp:Transcript_41684/g.107916  ORF Transcript_41684/g.107916 Transcript_41684/m.107916 type:complete len:1336 (+) Transcript_41684:116-4123(+)
MGQGNAKRTPLKRFINCPEEVSTDAIEGYLLTSPVPLTILDTYPAQKVVVWADWKKDKVAVVSGGGTGHEPADLEFVGPGMLAGTALGRSWAAPTVDGIVQAIAAVTGEKGCIFIANNSFGSKLNMKFATQQVEKKLGHTVKIVCVADDVVSMSGNVDRTDARSIAGRVFVLKVAGAAAAAGGSLDEVYRETQACADSVSTIGVAFNRGTAFIEAWTSDPPPPIPEDSMEIGIGVHGEPGWMRVPAIATAKDIVDLMITRLQPCVAHEGPLAVMLNNLGSVPRMEMLILAKEVMASPIAGRIKLMLGPAAFFTALNTNGISISICALDDQRAERLLAPTDCGGWQRPTRPQHEIVKVPHVVLPSCELVSPRASAHPEVARLFSEVCEALREAKDELGAMSAKTGTGKLGLSVARFANMIHAKMSELPLASPRKLFSVLAHTCEDEPGVLFALAKLILHTASQELGDEWNFVDVVNALRTGTKTAQATCDMQLNRRTLLDALLPALEVSCQPSTEEEMRDTEFSWWRRRAASAARRGARATSQMIHASNWAAYAPMTHRAGSPDGGAVVVALIFTALETPQEGVFRRLPEEAVVFGDQDEMRAEELAKKEIGQFYKIDDELMGKGSFRRVRCGTCLQGDHKGEQIAIVETHESEIEELGLKRFRNAMVMEKKRLMNWLFREKSHVVQVFEIILTPKSYYYVTEFLGGKPLSAILNHSERLSNARKYDVIHQMALGIHQVHSSRFIHRDIKAENFRYAEDGTLKLIDVCGMLCTVSETNDRQVDEAPVIGTLAYMSPEALVGMGRQAADMWAVGVIVHQLLVKSFPFEVTTIEEARKVTVEKELDFTDVPWLEVPKPFIKLLEGLLDRNCRNRFTVEQVLEHLSNVDEDVIPHEASEFSFSPDSRGHQSNNGDPGINGTASPKMGPVYDNNSKKELDYYRSNSASWRSTINWSRSSNVLCVERAARVTKIVYLVRHGEALHNIQERIAGKDGAKEAAKMGIDRGTAEFQGVVEAYRTAVLQNPEFFDAPLSNAGKVDSYRAKCEIAGLKERGLPTPTTVLTSPLQRTLQTTALIFPFHPSVHAREDLRERQTGLPCDSRHTASKMSQRGDFGTIDFQQVERADEGGYIPEYGVGTGAVEDKSMLRKRCHRFLKDLRNLQVSDEGKMQDHSAICLVTHKGFLRELERGALGQPHAVEFGNCELRAYEVQWHPDGEVDTANCRCLYSNASLCTLQLQNFPASWLLPENILNLPWKCEEILAEFGEMREPPVARTAEGGHHVVTVVYIEQAHAAAAARKLDGVDTRTPQERLHQPSDHKGDRLSVRLLYDIEQHELAKHC